MPRAARGFKARQRRKRVLRAASGFRGGRRRMWRQAVEAIHHAWKHAYVGRKRKKRGMRRLWIVRIGAAARQHGLSYSRFIAGMKKKNVELDRKVLAELAISDPEAFARVVESVRGAQ